MIGAGPPAVQQMVVDDTGAILDFLDAASPCARAASARSATAWADATCSASPDISRAASSASASLHGTTLISDAPDSPHLLVSRFRGELYCGFAETDPYAPLSMVKELDELLRPCPVDLSPRDPRGRRARLRAAQSRHLPPRGAARDWEMIFAMFHRQIPSYVA